MTIESITSVAQNEAYSRRLGWAPGDIVPGATTINAEFVTGVAARQTELGLRADGVAGPKTYAAVLVQRQATLAIDPASPPEARLMAAGLTAMIEGKRLWLRNIVDLPPPISPAYEASRSTIDQLIRSPLGLGWSWEPEYTLNHFEWCGAFAAYCWRAAGTPLQARKNFFASTYRLDRWARYQRAFEDVANPKPSSGPYRIIVELDEKSLAGDLLAKLGDTRPRAGDIILLGGVNTAYGKHICLVESFDQASGTFMTLEGNGTGYGPNGLPQHGVIRSRRRIGLAVGLPATTYFVRRFIRPAPHDI